jgi:hypothetical protein
MTLAQQRTPDGPSVPGQERATTSGLGIDLGSRYASQLGFEGVKAYDSDSASSGAEIVEAPSSDSSKKRKKKRKSKKNKQALVEQKEMDEESEDGDEVELEC